MQTTAITNVNDAERWVSVVAGAALAAYGLTRRSIAGEVPNELIGWRSVHHAASVHFTRTVANRGTEVKVILRYDPPGGILGAMIAKLLGEDPARQVEEYLATLKQVLEKSEPTSAVLGPES